MSTSKSCLNKYGLNYRIIIFEGLDNTGKDTQIKLLKNLFNEVPFQTLHFSGVKHEHVSDAISYSTEMFTDMFEILRLNKPFILNRSHLGEAVYSPLYRDYLGDFVFKIESRFQDVLDETCLITFIDSSEKVSDREDGLSFSQGKIDKIKVEISLFEEAHDNSNIQKKILIDIADKSIEEVHTIIKKFIKV